MAERPPLIHPKLADFLPEQYPDECTIQALVETEDEWGEPEEEWVDYYPDWRDDVENGGEAVLKEGEPTEDHRDLPALIAPSGGREVKQDDKTYTVSDFYISMKAYIPAVKETMRAVVSGQEYNILLVEHTSRQMRTRLTVEVVR